MPTVALIGPELYPIPPIRGGAAELFIEKVAEPPHAAGVRWSSGCPTPSCPAMKPGARRSITASPSQGWRQWLYCRYRNYFPLYDRQVARIINRVQPDLIHVHNRPLLALSLQRRLRRPIPVILHMHNLYESLGKRERPRPGTAHPGGGLCRLQPLRAWTGNGPDWGWARACFRVIYNGVETGAFASLWDHEPPASKRCAAHYGLGDEPTVLFAGKLRESKGVHILLRAMTRVWETAPRAVLVLVGGTEYGRDRTMRETPFLAPIAPGPGRGPRAGWCSPGLSRRLRCPGPISWGTSSWARPRSRRAWAWFFWKRPRPASPSSPPAWAASRRWCGTA